MNAPYLLIPIGITLTTLYILSWFLSRLGIFQRSFHRKFWNWLLVFAFLLSAVLGIIMVFQINNKLDIPGTEKILKWHVNFGIALSLIGIFHLLWHYSYYLPFMKTKSHQSKDRQNVPSGEKTEVPNRFFAFLIGYSGILTQTLLVREFLSLFHGNEMNVALIIFVWLLVTGIGAILGRSKKKAVSAQSLSTLGYILIFLPLFTLLMPRLLFPALIPPGVEPAPLILVAIVILSLLAYCLIGGFSFTYLTRLAPKENAFRIYAWESIGGAFAGILLSLIIYINLSEQITFLVATLPMVLTWLWFSVRLERKIKSWIPSLVWLLLFALFAIFPIERMVDSKSLPNQTYVKSYHGTTGKMIITRSEEQLNLFFNGLLTQSSDNVYFNEELVHFAMVQRPDAGNVLVLGGTVMGIDREIMKYPVRKIRFIESDRMISKIASNHHLLADTTLSEIVITDGLRFIRKDTTHYDVILSPLPGPYTLNLNRFYTDLFFGLVKRRLSPAGYFLITLPGTANYVSGEAGKLISSVVLAAKKEFTQVRLFPGESTYLIATDASITNRITEKLDSLGIQNKYLNSSYFDDYLFSDRVTSLNELTDVGALINSANRPMGFFYQISWWMNQYSRWFLLIPGIGIFILVLVGAWTKKTALSGMFLMGASGAGFELVVLIILQTAVGSIYQLTGVILASFMIGLALGSRFGSIRTSVMVLTTYGALFACVSILLALLARTVSHHELPTLVVLTLLLILNLSGAYLVGAYYKGITSQKGSVFINPGTVYAYDLMGAAVGALVFPILLIPFAGMIGTSLILASFGLLTLGIGYVQNQWARNRSER